jgi:putative acetyltransferase
VAVAFGQSAEAEIVRRVRKDASVESISLVAERNTVIVGHVLFSKVSIASSEELVQAVGVGPISVLPIYQSQGIGSELMRDGLARCKAQGNLACFVLGSPAYYHRFGFKNAYQAGFWYRNNKDNPVFQVLFWNNTTQQLPSGEIRYADVFSLAN